MSIKTILVPIRGDGKGEGVLDHACALASRFGSHIEAIHARARPEEYLPFGTLISAGMKETILQSARANAEEEEKHFQTLFKNYCTSNNLLILDTPPSPGNRVTASWREETGKQATVIAIRGRLADVIAVPRPDHETRLGVNTLEAALTETGKLVLMTPPGPAKKVGSHVAIAWNGSSESSRAVTLAMPILSVAKKVTILVADTGGGVTLSAEDLADHLRWHNIEPEVISFTTSSSDIGGPVLKQVEEAGADLLVMGAYGQNRHREWVLGGVTQYVIEHSTVPVLLSH